MRYYEFIVEYKTDITKNNYGQKILDKIGLPTIVQRKAFPPRGLMRPHMYENDYTMGALDLMDTPRINPIDNSHNVENITLEDYNEHKDEIVDWLLRQFEYFDPTPNKQYTQQIIKWFLNAKSLSPQGGFPSIEDGISTLKQSLYSFAKMKERLPVDKRDIASYPDVGTFMSSVQKMRQEFGKPDDLPKGDFQTIYEKDGVVARWPKNQEAACYLGQGTQWCTAATQSNNMFDTYNNRGALIVIQLAEPIRFYGEPEYNWSPNDESWEDIVRQIQYEYERDDSKALLRKIEYGFYQWISDHKLDEYDKPLIDKLVNDRKKDKNEIEEFIDSNSGPTSEAIDRYKEGFRKNNPEEYENRIKNGYEYMNWVQEYVKNFMEDELIKWLEQDIRANKEVEAEASELAREDLTISDYAFEIYSGFEDMLVEYDIHLQGPETEDQDSKTSSKIQMHIVPTKDGFKIDSMMDERDEEVPLSELSTPEEGDTALSKAWRNQGPDSLQDAIRRVSEYIERMHQAKRTNNL
jgi:hypothetical protein